MPLKGVGFFLGGALLTLLGFAGAVLSMAAVLALVWLASLVLLKRISARPRPSSSFATSCPRVARSMLSAARLFLFGARDVVRGGLAGVSERGFRLGLLDGRRLPCVLDHRLRHCPVGRTGDHRQTQWQGPGWSGGMPMGSFAGGIACGVIGLATAASPQWVLIGGLMFGVLFAVNSSLHSYLIVSYAKEDGVSLDVGFYYMSNALGRLVGTLLSGVPGLRPAGLPVGVVPVRSARSAYLCGCRDTTVRAGGRRAPA